MAEQTWGDLPESQISNRLITQAISDAIATHETDPTAHLGAGESLEQHKSNEVLDHPQQSVVLDKALFASYDEGPSPIGGYGWEPETGTISGEATRHLNFSLFSQSSVLTQERLPQAEDSLYPNADLLLRFFLVMNGAQFTDGSTVLRLHDWDSPDLKGRIEFVKSTTFYKVNYYYNNVLVHSYTLQSGGQFSGNITLFYNYTELKIDLFLEGILVDSYTPTVWYDFIPYFITAEASRSTNTSLSLSITRWGARYILY